MFDPTRRPNEAITTGAYPAPVAGGGLQPTFDADDIIREMYRKRPSPWLLRLMRGG